MLKYYAGIGSRETPKEVLALMQTAALVLGRKGWVLRTGGAEGADTAFLTGALGARLNQGTPVELYLPWPGFNGHDNCFEGLANPTAKALNIARQVHPAWDKLKQGGQKLHGRNTHQVLGADCDTPASFILCWTPKGAGGGGTGQAIRLAQTYGVEGIPVFDLAKDEHRQRVEAMLRG